MFNALTPEQRLEKAVYKIMAHPQYAAMRGVLMIGERKVIHEPPKHHPPTAPRTAFTDGKNEYYFAEFIEKLSDAQLRFLVIHEVEHKLFKHLTTWQHLYRKQPQLANAACDYVINIGITDRHAQDNFAEMPPDGLVDPKYRGWDSGAVYRDLYENIPDCDTCGGTGHAPEGEDGDGDGESQQCPDCQGSGKKTSPGSGFDYHDWEAAQDMTEAEREQLARDVDQALRQGMIAAGKEGSGGDRDFGELLQPQVDWRKAMREFVQDTCAGRDYSTWNRPNRRYIGARVYLPTGISQQIGELVIAVDTSGSIGQAEITRMLSEVKEIAETVHPKAVRLLYWDTQVCVDERYEMHELDNLVNSTKPGGGGGTMVECVPEYMRENNITPQAAVIFTDGYLGGTFGEWVCPTLWVILDNDNCTAPFGKTLHVQARNM